MYLFTDFPFLIFMLTLAAIPVVWLFVLSALKWPGNAYQVLMIMLAITSIATVALSDRQLNVQNVDLDTPVMLLTSDGLMAKALLSVVVIYAFSLTIASAVRANSLQRLQASRLTTSPAVIQPRQSSTDLVVSFMLFYVALSILPILLGKQFYFHISLVYPFFIYLSLFLWAQASKIALVDVARASLGIIAICSLVFALLRPEFAIQEGYRGLIPGYESRLWGLAANANGLGAVACSLFLIEAALPYQRKWIHRAILASAALTLLLCQSKTALFTTAVGGAIILAWRWLPLTRGITNPAQASRGITVLSWLWMLCVLFSAFGLMALFYGGDVLASLTSRLDSRGLADISTATGRTFIWEAAIKAGLDSPFFGQGANYWSLDSRESLGLSGATNAHNLALDVFTRSGLTGLLFLLVFLFCLVRHALRAAHASAGLSIGLLAVFFIRSVTEVPIQPNAILGAEFFSTMALIFFVSEYGAKYSAHSKRTVRNSFAGMDLCYLGQSPRRVD